MYRSSLEVGKEINASKGETLGLLTHKFGKSYPTYGGILLFGKNRFELFPDSVIRCARFAGKTKETILDQQDITAYLPDPVGQAITFIERHTYTSSIIGRVKRRDIPEYPPVALREAVINAIVHADYAIKGIAISIAIFDSRIEITNPGGLPFGLTLELALGGASRLRNRVLGRVFRELKLIEQWGSGLQRIIYACQEWGT